MKQNLFLAASVLVFVLVVGLVFWQRGVDQARDSYFGNQTQTANVWLNLNSPNVVAWEAIDRYVGGVVYSNPTLKPWQLGIVYSVENTQLPVSLPNQYVVGTVNMVNQPQSVSDVLQVKSAEGMNVSDFFQRNSTVAFDYVNFTTGGKQTQFLRNILYYVPPKQ